MSKSNLFPFRVSILDFIEPNLLYLYLALLSTSLGLDRIILLAQDLGLYSQGRLEGLRVFKEGFSLVGLPGGFLIFFVKTGRQ